jgi:hypothetical protein
MEITTYIAVYGAVISTIALGWNIYKQATNGPKLVGSAISGADIPRSFWDRSDKGILLRVMNRGNAETTIQRICLQSFAGSLGFARRRIYAERELGEGVQGNVPPHTLSAGAEFCCCVPQEQYVGQSCATRLYFCVSHSMSDRPLYVRVLPIKGE